jgi:hypothetical protein
MARADPTHVPPAPGVPNIPDGKAEGNSRDTPHVDSGSLTLPSAYAIPKLMVDPKDLDWFDVNDEILGFLSFVDGVRTIAQIADARGERPSVVQLRVADLRDRGVVLLD